MSQNRFAVFRGCRELNVLTVLKCAFHLAVSLHMFSYVHVYVIGLLQSETKINKFLPYASQTCIS